MLPKKDNDLCHTHIRNRTVILVIKCYNFVATLDRFEHCVTTDCLMHDPIYSHQTWQSPDDLININHQQHLKFYDLQTHQRSVIPLH